jgi:hypothetical protein
VLAALDSGLRRNDAFVAKPAPCIPTRAGRNVKRVTGSIDPPAIDVAAAAIVEADAEAAGDRHPVVDREPGASLDVVVESADAYDLWAAPVSDRGATSKPCRRSS